MRERLALVTDHARFRQHLEAVHGAWSASRIPAGAKAGVAEWAGWVGCGRLLQAVGEIERDIVRHTAALRYNLFPAQLR